jgi:AcrR family transcriptional regulator
VGIAERRAREREQRRESIVLAAEKLFFSQGYDRTTMDAIAEVAELNKATLYLYFTNKHDLYHAIVHRGLLLLIRMLEEATAVEGPGMTRVGAAVSALAAFQEGHPDYYAALHHRDTNRADPNAPQQTPYDRLTDQVGERLFHIIEKVIRSGVDDGSVRSDIDSRMAALLVLSHAHGALHFAWANDDFVQHALDVDRERMIRASNELILRSLRPVAG